MSEMYYKRVEGRCHGMRGFRVKHHKRFSVKGLSEKFFYIFRVFKGWRCSYGQDFKLGKRNICRSSSKNDRSSRRDFIIKEVEVPNVYQSGSRFSSFARSNSFYSEAISDCLEFIKRTSTSVDEKPINPR